IRDAAELHRREFLHVRTFPTEFFVPVRWQRIGEPDRLAADILVKITVKIEGDTQGLCATAVKANPPDYFPGETVVEFPVDEVLIGSPGHTVGSLMIIPGRAPGGQAILTVHAVFER